jgi:hypothetical protein
MDVNINGPFEQVKAQFQGTACGKFDHSGISLSPPNPPSLRGRAREGV